MSHVQHTAFGAIARSVDFDQIVTVRVDSRSAARRIIDYVSK